MHQHGTFDNKNHEMTPIGMLFDLQHGQLETEVSATQSRRVLLKIDLVVMPLIVLAMTLAFLDKVFTHFRDCLS
jgi:hypothetical protein